MLERKLKGHDYMQAHIEFNENRTKEVLVSYYTPVVYRHIGQAIVEDLGVLPLNAKETYWCSGLYSSMTIKHISLYCRECGISYYDLKLIANTNWYLLIVDGINPYVRMYYNPNTGEILQVNVGEKESYYKRMRKYICQNN